MIVSNNNLQGTIYFVISAIGVIGNIVVLAVLHRTKGRMNVSNIYLFNLALADELFVICLPLWGYYQFNGMVWSFGTFFCKFIGAITYVNMYASVMFLTAMSIDRWVAIARATKPNSCRKLNLAQGVCSVIWLMSFLLSSPSFIYRNLRPFTANVSSLLNNASFLDVRGLQEIREAPMKCEFYIPKENKNKFFLMGTMKLLRSLIGFVVPFTVIICCYIGIVITIKNKTQQRHNRQAKVTRISVTIISAFFICWAPYHVINLYSALGGWWKWFRADKTFYDAVMPYFVCIAYANSCLNPILYAFSSSNFQKNIKILCCKKKNPSKGPVTNRIREEKAGKTCTTPLNSPNPCSKNRQNRSSSPKKVYNLRVVNNQDCIVPAKDDCDLA